MKNIYKYTISSSKLTFVLIMVSLFGIISCGRNTDSSPSRPNILFIMSDDHAYQAISAYDDRLIQTPNIDRIANEGALFTNSCVTNSICAPSRATILTGKHNHINGKIDNRSPFDTTQVTFPQLFQESGYQSFFYLAGRKQIKSLLSLNIMFSPSVLLFYFH